MDYQPTQKRNPFIIAALAAGIFSLLSICTGILPLILGSLGILFALLSRRKGKRLETPAFIGMITSIMSIAFSLVIIIMSFAALPAMLKSSEYRKQLNEVSESMYGYSFDEIIEEGYGIDLDELFDID